MSEAAEIEWHVSLRAPMTVKLGGEPVAFRSFDAHIVDDSDPKALRLESVRFYTQATPRGVTMKTTVVFPLENLAGMIPGKPTPK